MRTDCACTSAGFLSICPSVEHLIDLKVVHWFELGKHLGLTEDVLENMNNSQSPAAETLLEARIKNRDMQWKDIVEGLRKNGEYELAASVCSIQGWLIDIHTNLMPFHAALNSLCH